MEEKKYDSKYCMEFSNEELYEYFIRKFENNSEVVIRTLSDGEEVQKTSNMPIEVICFDGYKEELFISFYGNQTSIFVKDEEIMFIDESIRNNYTISDTYGNVVYEGRLRNLTHIKILSLFSEIIRCFIGAIEVEIIEKEIACPTDDRDYYKPYSYEVNVKNNNFDRKQKKIENIIINY